MQVYINSIVTLLLLMTSPLHKMILPSAVQSSRTTSLLYCRAVPCCSYNLITHHSKCTLVLFCPSSRHQFFYILDTTLMADAFATYRPDFCVSHYLTFLSYFEDFYFVSIIHVCPCFSCLGPEQLPRNVNYWHTFSPEVINMEKDV
jgi:hypothetical protein